MLPKAAMVEILKNRMQAIADEMASVVLRTGFTVFVKETGDFGCSLASTQGEVFASPVKTGVTVGPGMDFSPIVRHVGVNTLRPGDVIITNDPETSRGLVTHLADIFLVAPIFIGDEIICYGTAFIHSSDVGGKVPGSITPTAYDIYQEGLRIPPSKLVKAGRLDEELLGVILANTRIPEQNWGDLKALLSALTLGARRMGELVERYGIDTVRQGIVDLLDYAEQESLDLIRKIPAGSYEAWDYIEGDAFDAPPVRIRCRMDVTPDGIHLDFSGTDPQVRGAFNLPSYSNPHHYMLTSTFVRYFRTVRPDLPYNQGLVRRIHCHTPEGTLLNPTMPAAVGVRAATMIRVLDVTMALLGLALKDRIPAAGAGQACIVLLALPEIRRGKARVGVLQPLVGGSGARPTKDGIDGIDHQVGWTRNIPTETIETEMPVVILRYGLRQDSGGAGRFRGGCGLELGVLILASDVILTARGMERTVFRPWGRDGGAPGALGVTTLHRRGEASRVLGKIDELLLQRGDRIWFATQGGGGYGDTRDRDLALLRRDVLNGLVSAEAAARDYGRDVAAQDSPAQTIQPTQRPAPPFVFGPERDAFEARWPDALQLAVNELVAAYPISVRGPAKARLIKRMDESELDPRAWTIEVVQRTLQELEAVDPPPDA
jgi:N-methylhydantoinase B